MPNTGQILKSKIIINKKRELKIGEELYKIEMERYEKKELIDTIKIPRNLKEINGNLPTNKYNKNKTKKLNEEMMKEDEYETNKRLKGFLKDEDKREIQKLYGNNFNSNKNKINNINNIGDMNSGNYKNNFRLNGVNDKLNNNLRNDGFQINKYNSDENRINNMIRNKQKLFNQNSNNKNKYHLNNDLNSVNEKLNDLNSIII